MTKSFSEKIKKEVDDFDHARKKVREIEDPSLYFGVVDIGSNGVRLVIYKNVDGRPLPFIKLTVKAGLAEGMSGMNSALSNDGMTLAHIAFHGFGSLLREAKIPEENIMVYATAAMRDSEMTESGKALQTIGKISFGHDISIISGTEEGILGAIGVMHAWENAATEISGLCVDLGGGSLELTKVVEGEIKNIVSLPFGALVLAARAKAIAEANGDITKYEEIARQSVHDELSKPAYEWVRKSGPIFALGGNIRALGKLWLHNEKVKAEDFDEKLHGYNIAGKKVEKRLLQFLKSSHKLTKNQKAILEDREVESLRLTAIIFDELAKIVEPNDMIISTQGAREGAAELMMDPALQAKYPQLYQSLRPAASAPPALACQA